MNSLRLMKSSPSASTFIIIFSRSSSSSSDAHLRLPTMTPGSSDNIEFLKNCSSSAIKVQLFTTRCDQPLLDSDSHSQSRMNWRAFEFGDDEEM
ncbi:hypothetical protein PanWU01x14_263750 [Parasponia andersonii]|uniref:Uncharacterized protein n=1 Tax=Parasponia andersonii TaxID=3476 RepID=A0A2P5B7P7_PARAD|nr:hypothetical protein PanWU01x14_263750 [Parasponia andersonii]